MAAHNKETRDKIAAAAHRLIVEQGFAAASIVAIRVQAGLSNGSFYCAFESRDALIDHLIDSISASRKAGMRAAMYSSGRSGRYVLEKVLRAHLQWLAENPDLAQLRESLMQGLAVTDPEKHTAAMAWEIGFFADWARPLMIAGTIRRLSDRLLYALILSNVDAVGREWNADASQGTDEIASALIDAAWVAIKAPVRSTKSEPPPSATKSKLMPG